MRILGVSAGVAALGFVVAALAVGYGLARLEQLLAEFDDLRLAP